MSAWMKGLFSEPDGTPSSRRLFFAGAVVFAMAIVGDAHWSTRTLKPEIIDMVKTLLYATAAALGIGKFAEGAKNV